MTTSEVQTVRIEMLGGFRVRKGAAAPGAWPSRRAAELVQLLALAPTRRLARDQVIEALWPTLGADAGAANLRKAAYFARRATGDPEAVVLRAGEVHLFAGRGVETDVEDFERAAERALATGDAEECAALAAAYAGELLPEARYEAWTQAAREQLRSLHVELLRRAGDAEGVVAADPTDEGACRELMRRALAAGNRPAAIRWYGLLRSALRRELGLAPGPETAALYEECVAGLAAAEPQLIGRQLELARIEACLREPDPGMLVLRGPGGIGKTALGRELARLARAGGWTVATVAATEVGGSYAPLADAVERLVAADSSLPNAVGEAARGVLAQLADPGRADRALTRHAVIGAIRRLLTAAARDGRVVLHIDDAHLADAATIDVLGHLTSSPTTAILVALGYRPEAAPEALTRVVARLARAGRVAALDLAPLGDDDAALLVAVGAATRRAPETVERIVALGEGNPFLILELARSATVGVPALAEGLRDAVAARFLDLADDTTATLRRIALTGDDLDAATVAAVAGATDEEAFHALDVALATGALVVDGARYRFRHELVRQALIGQLPPHRRAAEHREIAGRLTDVRADAALVGRHWVAGRRPAEAVPWLVAAARAAVALGAFADALGHLAPVLAHDPVHVEALRLRAASLDALGDPSAPGAYRAAADVLGGPERDDLRAMGGLARIKLGDAPGGLAELEGLAPATLDGRIAHALGFAGAAALGFGDPAIGAAKAGEARRLAFASGDPGAITVASWAQAAAAHARGELRDSIRADLRDTAALPHLAVNAFDGQLCITQRLLYGARPYADVIGFADLLEAEALRLGAARGRAFAVTIRGEARLLHGMLAEAEADLVAGRELHREIGGATGEAFALQRRAELEWHRGDDSAARALLDEALAIARESGVGFHLFDRIYGTRIVIARDADEAHAAVEEAEAAVRGPVETCPGCRITLAMPAAIAAARANDHERVAHYEPVAEYLAKVVMRLPAWDAALDEFHGHKALSAGDPDAARERFAAAAAGFAAAGHPLDEARCRKLSPGL